MKALLCAVLLFVGIAVAHASEGVYQINAACAAVGCFAGDGPGFPVTIAVPGNYRLTSNLVVSSSLPNATAVDAITVASSATGASIDLNGFSLIGPSTCTGTPVTSCSPSGGFGAGISARSGSAGVRVANGTVRGFQIGVACSRSCIIDAIRATENVLIGLTNSNDKAIVRNSISERNGDYGIFAAGKIDGCVASGNGGIGIFSNPQSILTGNESVENGGDGLRCFSCLLLDNVSSRNGGFGVDMGSNASYARNLFAENTSGSINGSGLQLGPNRCGFGLCP